MKIIGKVVEIVDSNSVWYGKSGVVKCSAIEADWYFVGIDSSAKVNPVFHELQFVVK